jgi:acylphosphatase
MFYAAKNHNVTGWVRNCSDGSVEAVAQGDENDVREFIRWAWKGPSLCHVENVEISETSGQYSTFEIKPTY